MLACLVLASCFITGSSSTRDQHANIMSFLSEIWLSLFQVRKGHQCPFFRMLGLIFHGQSQDQDPSREPNIEYQQTLGQSLGPQSPGHCPRFNHQSTLSKVQWETISSWCDLHCEASSPSMAQERSQQTELPSAASYLGTLLLKNPRGSVKPEEITVCPRVQKKSGGQ